MATDLDPLGRQAVGMTDNDAPVPYWPAWLSATYANDGTPTPYQLTPTAEAALAELEAG